MIQESSLTPEYAAQLLISSFGHSQGSYDLQGGFFEVFHSLRPHWHISPEDVATITALTLLETVKHIKSANHAQDINTPILYELNLMIPAFQSALGKPDDPKPEIPNEYKYRQALIERITRDILDRDHKFLIDDGGRPRSHGYTEDPYFSYFRNYVILGQSTGLSEFDQMYQECQNYFIEHAEDHEWTTDPTRVFKHSPGFELLGIAGVWEKMHNKEPFFSQILP